MWSASMCVNTRRSKEALAPREDIRALSAGYAGAGPPSIKRWCRSP